jgi:hypothetical protein
MATTLPLKYDFKAGHPITSFYTFNDDVIWENVLFLIQCYQTLGEQPSRAHKRGHEFLSYLTREEWAWGQQCNMKMEVAGQEPMNLLLIYHVLLSAML